MKAPGALAARRTFLLAATAGAAAGAAHIAGNKTDRAQGRSDASGAASPPAARGYELTEHVRKYYRTARI